MGLAPVLLTVLLLLLPAAPVLAAVEEAVLAGGCFWCLEHDLETLPGVVEAVSGFSGGSLSNPTYRQVSAGGTGHIESVRVRFHTARISLPTLLRAADVPVAQFTSLTAVLVLPWVLKFLWAPVLDLLRGPRWGYRAWIVVSQLVMAATLVPLVWLDPVASFDSWRLLLLMHAVAAATQDVAIDALVIGTAPPQERGRLNGAMQAGMLVGRSLFGGGVLLVGTTFGTSGIIVALIAWICVPLLLIALVREPARLVLANAPAAPMFAFRPTDVSPM